MGMGIHKKQSPKNVLYRMEQNSALFPGCPQYYCNRQNCILSYPALFHSFFPPVSCGNIFCKKKYNGIIIAAFPIDGSAFCNPLPHALTLPLSLFCSGSRDPGRLRACQTYTKNSFIQQEKGIKKDLPGKKRRSIKNNRQNYFFASARAPLARRYFSQA